MPLPRDPRDAVHQELLECEVEQADGHAEHDRQDDDHARRLDQLGARRPGHLPHLGARRLEERPRGGDAAGRALLGDLDVSHGYFDSLCGWCLLHCGQYLRRSTRSGCFRLFLSPKKFRLLQSVHSRMILSRGMEADPQLVVRTVGTVYFRILVTTPAPTVRPPSRMANRSPSSIAIGMIRSIVIWMLSPGITISTPAGSSTVPVTSVVRK